MRDLIVLHPECGDDVDNYLHHMTRHPVTGVTVAVLDRKPDGSCIYLGDSGCRIHDRAPVPCREFDCRRFFKSLTRNERRRLVRAGAVAKVVLDAGRARLHTI